MTPAQHGNLEPGSVLRHRETGQVVTIRARSARWQAWTVEDRRKAGGRFRLAWRDVYAPEPLRAATWEVVEAVVADMSWWTPPENRKAAGVTPSEDSPGMPDEPPEFVERVVLARECLHAGHLRSEPDAGSTDKCFGCTLIARTVLTAANVPALLRELTLARTGQRASDEQIDFLRAELEAAEQRELWVVIDEGCHECGVGSVPIGLYRTAAEAEAAREAREAETHGWRDGGTTIATVFGPLAAPQDKDGGR